MPSAEGQVYDMPLSDVVPETERVAKLVFPETVKAARVADSDTVNASVVKESLNESMERLAALAEAEIVLSLDSNSVSLVLDVETISLMMV